MPDGDTMEPSGNAEVRQGAGVQEAVPLPTPPPPAPPGPVTGEENPATPDGEEQPVRELSQTDHLNKSLLTSFLARLNDTNSPIPMPQAQDMSQTQGPTSTASLSAHPADHRGNEDEAGDGDASSPWKQDD